VVKAALFLFAIFIFASGYPVPTPPHGRQAIHGWLILPIDSDLPNWQDTSAPLDAWFSHHVPEFYTESPHDFQIILRGTIAPLPHAGNVTLPLKIPYPPKHQTIGYEYTFTPPPPFSLNSLLNGELTVLQGVVYNGSFDTTYERIPIAIARLDITDLTTAVYLNYSSSVVPYEYQTYYSYPRAMINDGSSQQHFYLGHNIHAAPDFDQLIQVIIDMSSCAGTNAWEIVSQPGIVWTFSGYDNILSERLLPSSEWITGTVTTNGVVTSCKMQVQEEIHCTVGPGFFERCDDYISNY